MKKLLLPLFLIAAGTIFLTSCIPSRKAAQLSENIPTSANRIHRSVYFNPEVYPDVEEIKAPSYLAFFDGVTEKISNIHQLQLTRVETPMVYDSVNTETLKEVCVHNECDLAVVPKIRYFKVGIGKYVFSNQVVVSMKMFDAKGTLLTETSYDSYKKNKRLLSSTTNSIKIGAKGAMNEILKEIRLLNRRTDIETLPHEGKELITTL